jgi:repressor of nif and glnA expression
MGCKTCYYIGIMPESVEKQKLLQALTSPEPKKQQIADFLTRRGYKVDEKSIRRHLRHQEVK